MKTAHRLYKEPPLYLLQACEMFQKMTKTTRRITKQGYSTVAEMWLNQLFINVGFILIYNSWNLTIPQFSLSIYLCIHCIFIKTF